MRMYYFLINSSIDTWKAIVVGTVGWGIIYTIYALTKSKEIKQDFRRSSHLKQVKKIDDKIKELKKLKEQNILDDTEFEIKLKEFEKQRKDLRVEYYLKQNDRYLTLKRSLEKGFINESQYKIKVDEIRNTISQNVK